MNLIDWLEESSRTERKDFRLFPVLLMRMILIAVIPLRHKFRQLLFQFLTVITVN